MKNYLKLHLKPANHIYTQECLHKFLVIEGFPIIPKSVPHFPKAFSFDFIKFSMIKLFNIQ
jgi:hypothetical protein